MKRLMLVCGLAVVAVAGFGAAIAGCGPKELYCKENSIGKCLDDSVDAGPSQPDVQGPGDAIIIGQD